MRGWQRGCRWSGSAHRGVSRPERIQAKVEHADFFVGENTRPTTGAHLTAVRRHPLISFFVLVFALTWGIGAVAIAAPKWFESHFDPMTPSNPIFFLAVWHRA